MSLPMRSKLELIRCNSKISLSDKGILEDQEAEAPLIEELSGEVIITSLEDMEEPKDDDIFNNLP